jgi:hypothetical protein
MNKLRELPEKVKSRLRDSGSHDEIVALAAQKEFAQALTLPLRQGVLNGDILNGIFEAIPLDPGVVPEFPLDLLAPGTEDQHVAYSLPNSGYIPQRHVEGDYVMIPTYDIGNAIDWNLKYARNARWDVVRRATEVFRAGFIKKNNDDGAHTLITAAADRNIVVLDSDAQAGQFTKRLLSLGKLVMRRNGGGNSTSVNRGQLTDVAMSPEGMEGIRNWNVDQVDEVTRREIFVAEGNNVMSRIFGVNLHVWDEFGVGQEYNNFYTNELGGSFPTGDVELLLGLDLSKSDSFVQPIDEPLQVFPDPTLHRQRRAGLYGCMRS